MKHVFPFQKQNNSFLYEAPDYSLRKQSNKIGFLLCAAIAAMYLFSYALQWFLIGIDYQKSTYNEINFYFKLPVKWLCQYIKHVVARCYFYCNL